MWSATGQQIAREARAAMNMDEAYSTFWTPVVNLAREPRWGRNIEVASEDPYQNGEYGAHFVKGFQVSEDDLTHVQASACCKHYVANEMEGSTEVGQTFGRQMVDTAVTMQDLMDSYMIPFQACVEKGDVTSLMCSYNAVNGVPSCANDWLLTTVAREEWGFDGYITSDCDADSDVFNNHNYTDTAAEAVEAVLKAGTDVDCGNFVKENIQDALDQSLVTEADIDERLYYLFRIRMRLSHFDPTGPLDEIKAEDTICTDYSINLARDGLVQSAVLLKNDANTLPLVAANVGSVAVIGPNSELAEGDISQYYGPHNHCDNDGKYDLVSAIGLFADDVATVKGIENNTSTDTSGIPDAVAAAKSADQVILAVGTDLGWAREGTDAVSVAFSDEQAQLIKEVADAASKPVVLVMFTANPLDLTDVLAHENIGAVLHVGQPGINIYAAGDLIFGKRSPAGRTIQTVYKKEYADQISIFDFNMRPGPSEFPRPDCTTPDDLDSCERGTNPGRTYRFYVDEPVIEFGYGLSYTKFDYNVVSAAKKVDLTPVREMLSESQRLGKSFTNLADSQGDMDGYVVEVTNSGDVDADEVVLGFNKPPGAGVDGVPLKSLFGFERVHVKAGETVTVTLYPTLNDFTVVDKDGLRSVVEGEYEINFGVESGGAFAKHILTAK